MRVPIYHRFRYQAQPPMARIFKTTENVFNAVGGVVADGYAAVEGTESIAVPYCNRIIDALAPYKDISPSMSYQNVKNRGYLYFVVDLNRFSSAGDELHRLIDAIDRNDPG